MPAPASAALKCERHGALAGWECTVCHHPLCPDCAALKYVPPVTLLACGLCGELAEPLVRRRSDTASLAQRLPGAFRFPFHGEGLPAWLGIGLFLWLMSFAGVPGLIFGWCATLGSLFGITRSTARGGDGLEMSDFRTPIDSILLPVARYAVAMFPAWAGATAASLLELRWLWWVTLVVAALWTPTAFIGAATEASVLHLLNPVRVLGASTRLGKDFPVYLGALLAVAALMLLAVPVGWYVGNFWVPVLSGVAGKMIYAYPAMVAARIAGLVLLLHGPVFGWGQEHEQYEPVLGDVQPRGELPPKERTLPRHLPTAIELPPEPEPPQFAPAPDRFAALEVSPDAPAPPEVAPLDVALLPSHAEQSAGSIRTAMRAGDVDAALDGFRATGLTCAAQLSFEELMWLGQTCAARIDYESALLAYEQASNRDAPPEAKGRAWVMLGRLLGEKLNRRPDAVRWMERVVKEHPGTQAAGYATKWLDTARG